jgi:phospholipid/cholesterol/gamma-HCH transport system ATP-binding protein
MITVRNLSKWFNDRPVLKDVSIVFERGKSNLIIGESGSGKTVLLKCIVGLLKPDEGDVFFDSIHFNKLDANNKRNVRKQIGMLFQGGALFDWLTVEENVMFPLEMFSEMSIEEKRDRAQFCLKRVNILNSDKLLPSELSGGMQKRVAIARAISLNPRYLFCDEPNSGLDPKTSILIDNLIEEITEEFDITTIVNTHDMNSVIEIGKKVIFIYKGEKEWEGTNVDILEAENQHLNDFVFATTLTQRLKTMKKL